VALSSLEFTGDPRLEQAAANAPPLKHGATGDAVRKLQRALMDEGFAMGGSIKTAGPDGIFGDETERVVKAFQHKHDLGFDGIAGHDTITKLDELNITRAAGAVAPVAPPPVTGFEVRGKQRRADPNKVFFVENKADIDGVEAAKVTAIAKPDDRQLTLNGFASEDETDRLMMVASRLQAVFDALKAAGHKGTKITTVLKPDAGLGRVDYRNMRAVEIVVAGA